MPAVVLTRPAMQYMLDVGRAKCLHASDLRVRCRCVGLKFKPETRTLLYSDEAYEQAPASERYVRDGTESLRQSKRSQRSMHLLTRQVMPRSSMYLFAREDSQAMSTTKHCCHERMEEGHDPSTLFSPSVEVCSVHFDAA